jgi:hypothetical protein
MRFAAPLVLIFVLFVWLDLVVSPLATFSAAALAAVAWCNWLDSRIEAASPSASPRPGFRG